MLFYDCSDEMKKLVNNFFNNIMLSHCDVYYDNKTETGKNYARNYCIMPTEECKIKEVDDYFVNLSNKIYNDFMAENGYTEKDLESYEALQELSDYECSYFDRTGEDFVVIELLIYESLTNASWIYADIAVKIGHDSYPFLTKTIKSIDGTCESIEKELHTVAEGIIKGQKQ